MKIGKYLFKEYAVMKPLALSASGKMLSVTEVASGAGIATGSLHAFPVEMQTKLALERYKQEPEFRLGIFNVGILSKSEVIRHIVDRTDFGRLAVQVEMQYCNELIRALQSKNLPHFPKMKPNSLPLLPEWKQIDKCLWFKLKSIALFAENTTDPVTGPFAEYRIAHVHREFEERGFHVVANVDTHDTRANFLMTAKKHLTVYESGIGHGNYDVYTGHAGEPILEIGAYDASEVSGKAIHFLSCQTASQLGPDTVDKGARCYAGFDENFTFVWDDPYTPVNEVDLFKKSDSIFDIYMANGFTAQQAYDAAIATFNASIALVPGTVTASWLSYNRDHLRLHGDPSTRILPYKYAKIGLPLKKMVHEEMLAEIGELID